MATKHKCIVKGCTNEIELSGDVSPNFRYVCSGRASYGDDKLRHDRAAQLRAIGREYDPEKDEADSDIHFQSFQHDKSLDKKGKKRVLISPDPESEYIKNIEGA